MEPYCKVKKTTTTEHIYNINNNNNNKHLHFFFLNKISNNFVQTFTLDKPVLLMLQAFFTNKYIGFHWYPLIQMHIKAHIVYYKLFFF